MNYLFRRENRGASSDVYAILDKETDATNPISFYGKTKLKGEQSIQELMKTNAIIIRTSWIYSGFGNNFVDTMLKLGKERNELNVVHNQISSPTYAIDLAKVILSIIQSSKFNHSNQTTQIYHYSNKGKCSWYGFAQQIFKLSEINCNVCKITMDKYLTIARRPKYTVLNKNKIIKAFDIKIPNWKISLDTFLSLNPLDKGYK